MCALHSQRLHLRMVAFVVKRPTRPSLLSVEHTMVLEAVYGTFVSLKGPIDNSI